MLTIENSACIAASIEQVWGALADLEKVSVWAGPILHARCEGSAEGVGALRVCQLKGNVEIRERWTRWVPGASFTYVGEGMPMVECATNTWSVREENGKVRVTSVAEITFKWGLLGRLLEVPMGAMMKRVGPRALAGLKFWIETGRPFDGDDADLPLAPVTC